MEPKIHVFIFERKIEPQKSQSGRKIAEEIKEKNFVMSIEHVALILVFLFRIFPSHRLCVFHSVYYIFRILNALCKIVCMRLYEFEMVYNIVEVDIHSA